MDGKLLIFNVDDIALVDINKLVDKGKRFDITNVSEHFDNVRDYLDEEDS